MLKVGLFVAGSLSHLPGTIGTAAGYVHKRLDYDNRIIDNKFTIQKQITRFI